MGVGVGEGTRTWERETDLILWHPMQPLQHTGHLVLVLSLQHTVGVGVMGVGVGEGTRKWERETDLILWHHMQPLQHTGHLVLQLFLQHTEFHVDSQSWISCYEPQALDPGHWRSDPNCLLDTEINNKVIFIINENLWDN